jgi:hypothetical protein
MWRARDAVNTIAQALMIQALMMTHREGKPDITARLAPLPRAR